QRRAEGIGYWGLSSVAAIALAPPVAFWIMQHGGWRWICVTCGALNVLMGAIAWALPDEGPIHGPVASELALRQAQGERVDASAPTATETTAGIDAVVESAGIDGVAESAGVAAGTEPADAPVGADPRVRPSTARVHPVIEWRVLVISLTLFMYSF